MFPLTMFFYRWQSTSMLAMVILEFALLGIFLWIIRRVYQPGLKCHYEENSQIPVNDDVLEENLRRSQDNHRKR